MKTFSTFICTFLLSITATAQLSQGDRILAYQVDMAEDMNYDIDFGIAKDACMESIHFSSNWSDYDTSSGSFDANYIANFLDLINIYMPINNTKVELQIATVNTNVLELPADLMGVPFSDPLVISRFKILLDTVFAHLPDLELSALNIGNESDIYFGTDANAYTQYGIFLDSVIPYAEQLYFNIHGDELKVGTTLTFDGLTSPATAALCASLNVNRDIVSVTYYPLEPNFFMEPPSVVTGDFSTLVNLYPDTNQPIYFVESGYSSSTVCNSSEALQADFYSYVFNAWDAHYDNIKYLTIFKTTDWSAADIAIFETYYGISDPAFLEYLRALGVRTWSGSGVDKLAFDRIRCELKSRNWCSLDCTTAIEEVSEVKWSIYPNPSEDFLTIETNGIIQHVEVITSDGKVIKSNDSSSNILDVRQLPNGNYIIRVKTTNGDYQTIFEKK